MPWQDDEVEVRLNDRLTTGAYYISHSLYVSPLFDDDRMDLATSLPPAEMGLLRGLGGEDIVAPKPYRVLPPGTEVKISRIEWPTAQHMWKRPLLTPRYHTWVVLTAAAAHGQTSLQHHKPVVLLLPADVTSDVEVDSWLSMYLSKKDVTNDVNQLASEVRQAIKEKSVLEGMTTEEMVLSWGHPTEVIKLNNTEEQEVMLFGRRRVILTNGKVSSVIVR